MKPRRASGRRSGAGPILGKPATGLLRGVRLLLLDVDGVLTDGRLWLGPGGEEWKSVHVHDGLAIARAIAAGLVVAVVSSPPWPAGARSSVSRTCAVPEIRRPVRWVTRQPGGAGALREALEAIPRAQGR